MRIGKPLILMVDDESHILHVLSMRLLAAGYQVVTAENGRAGLALAIEHQPQLIITDFQMPYLNGLELCQALAGHQETKHIVVLMLTARGANLNSACFKLKNLAGVITKPFSPREVVNRVQELVGTGDRRKVG